MTIIKKDKCNETIWLRIRLGKGVDLYIGCVFLHNQGNFKHTCTVRFNFLEEDICIFQTKEEFASGRF